MKVVADLHVHGRYSLATSKDLSLASLAWWAQCKGIDVVGTGDILHPAWRAEARQLLREADGLFHLVQGKETPVPCAGRQVRFMLTAEVSTIYSQGGRVRKVHHLVWFPSFEGCERVAEALGRFASMDSDGRPMVGLSSSQLLELILEREPQAVVVPAHIWTPWFSVLGSKSGFDSIEECYGSLTPHVWGIETGLSSDPPMNWRLSRLDRFTIVSFSDAHSADKLGREATVFECEPTFQGLRDALARGRVSCTVEFFPEEGKYHLDGHRACGVRLSPEETLQRGGTCPVCGGKVTVGVMHRVIQLADRPAGSSPPGRPPYVRLVPLMEVLAQVIGAGPSSRRVRAGYSELLRALGPELEILVEVPLDRIARVGGDDLASAIDHMRQGQVQTEPGYDGVYGKILLGAAAPRPAPVPRAVQVELPLWAPPAREGVPEWHPQSVVVAGPGSGKTHLLTQRMARSLPSGLGRPVGITFTRAAAEELARRLPPSSDAWTGTLHQLAAEVVRPERAVHVWGERHLAVLMQWELWRRKRRITLAEGLRLVRKAGCARQGEGQEWAELYSDAKKSAGVWDFDDLLQAAVDSLRRRPLAGPYSLFVDEFQDLDPTQYEMVLCLARGARSFMFIGDPWQSIYSFRGADPTLIRRVPKDFPQCRVETLSSSYRCAELVLQASDALVGRSPPMRSCTGLRGTVKLMRASSVRAEARMVAHQVKDLVGVSMERPGEDGSVRGLDDVAILVRTAGMMRVFAAALWEAGIPARVVRSQSLADREGIARLSSYLRLGLEPESVADLLVVRGWKPGEPSPSPLSWSERRELQTLATLPSHEAVVRLKPRCPGLHADEWDVVMDLARSHPAVKDLLRVLASERELGRRETGAGVRVMTMHAAKGLEFDAVVLPGFRRGMAPLAGCDEEEERRLWYVAMTRAKSTVVLTCGGSGACVSAFEASLPSGVERVRRQATQLLLALGEAPGLDKGADLP